MRYCQFCDTEHPLTRDYWYLLDTWPQCKTRVKERASQRYTEKREHCKAKVKARYQEKKTEIRQYHRDWAAANKVTSAIWRRDYEKRRRQLDIQYRLAKNLRTRIGNIIQGRVKSGSAVRDLGCSIEELKQYLEARFDVEMSWDNYGSEWHIDHIRPLANYDLTDREIFLQLVHYTNLQPLWAEDNIRKSNKEVVV